MTDAASPDDLTTLAAMAAAGEIGHLDLVHAFLDATIYVPSRTDPESAPIDPVISTVEDLEYLVVAASVDALQQTLDVAQFAVPMDGRVLLRGMDPTRGLFVQLDSGAFAIPRALLDDLRADLAPA